MPDIADPCAATSPRWSICWTNIWPSPAAKAARNPRSPTWASWCATPRRPPAKARKRDDIAVDAPEHLTVSVKRAALRRCLTNLIDNALKHGSQVAVSPVAATAACVEIAVEDNGQGIPEARREEAFRPFHRLDEGRNLQAGGSGLGLAIARDIARAHGGDIVLGDSALGGLKATIRLPV